MRAVVIVVVAFVTVACGGGSSNPVAPTARAPQVAGAYVGTVTIFYPQLARTLNCPASTTVNQTGFALSFSPMMVSGQCGNFALPIGDADIDSNGSIGNESGTVNEPSCGFYNYTASGGFFGRSFQFAMNFTSSTCIAFNISGTLTR